MRKLLFAFVMVFTLQAYCQNPYYDALKLREYMVTDSAGRTRFIIPIPGDPNEAQQKIKMKEYCDLINNNYYSGKLATARQVHLALSTTTRAEYNPFLADYLTPAGILSIDVTNLNQGTSANLISKIGGFNVTNFADGLAKFLVKRFKEELSISFFEKFKDEMSDPKHEDLQVLFPQTYKVLRVADKDIYNFSIYINTLREAFIKDLTNMYKSFKKVKDLPKYKSYFDSHVELNTLVLNAFYFIDQFTNGVHPGAVIANYNPDALLNFTPANINLQTNIRSSVKMLRIFSNSLKSTSADNYWVPADSVGMMLADPVTRDLYFGLLYQWTEVSISFQTKTGSLTFRHILEKAKNTGTEIEQFKEHIETIISHAQEVNEYITSTKEKKKSEVDYNDYYRLLNASLDILDDGLSLPNLKALNIDEALQGSIQNKASRLLTIARSSAELYTDIRTRNYSSAVLNTITLIDSIFENNFDSKLRSSILKYGNFAASVASAKNSDEVEKAIDAVALPAGSSRIKRESPVNVSLNAYVGGIAGWEYLPALKQKQTSGTVGFAAPVGIAFSFGNIKKKDASGKTGGKSFTFFLPIIDVGALASFRLHDDSSKVASEVQLKNIFAPGLFIYYGFGKCPISIGAGAQIGPQLREVTASISNIEKNYYVRYGISICVDIPLLNFYTKSK
ncbi:MAG: hypothetical protein ACM3H8_10500 [Sphingobacteriales bacterium]